MSSKSVPVNVRLHLAEPVTYRFCDSGRQGAAPPVIGRVKAGSARSVRYEIGGDIERLGDIRPHSAHHAIFFVFLKIFKNVVLQIWGTQLNNSAHKKYP